MEQCLRIALWMVVLIGYLHAGPVPRDFDVNEFEFDFLREISCNVTARFSSPTNVTGNCYAAGLKEFKKGMELAMNQCQDVDGRIDQTLDLMEKCLPSALPENCTFAMTLHEQFASFVNATERFIEEFNSHSRCKQ